MYREPKFFPCADSYISMEFGNEISDCILDRIRDFSYILEKTDISWCKEFVPSFRAILFYYDANKINFEEAKKELIPIYQKRTVVRVVLGPQVDHFTDIGIHTFLNSKFTASSRIDRWAYRFEGSVIAHSEKGADIISDGIALGAVQVPADGNPIVFMSDRPTTGGYSKIATVISVDISKIAQMKTGDQVQFKKIDIEEARKIFKDREQFF